MFKTQKFTAKLPWWGGTAFSYHKVGAGARAVIVVFPLHLIVALVAGSWKLLRGLARLVRRIGEHIHV